MNASEMEMRVLEARMDMEIACDQLPEKIKRNELDKIGEIARHHLSLCGSKFEEQTMSENMLEAGLSAL